MSGKKRKPSLGGVLDTEYMHGLRDEHGMPTQGDCEIYSPESSDGTFDWPSKIGMMCLALLACAVLYAIWVWF